MEILQHLNGGINNNNKIKNKNIIMKINLLLNIYNF